MFSVPPPIHVAEGSIQRPYQGAASRDFVTIPAQSAGRDGTCAHADSVKLAVAANEMSAAFATVTRALVPLNCRPPPIFAVDATTDPASVPVCPNPVESVTAVPPRCHTARWPLFQTAATDCPSAAAGFP